MNHATPNEAVHRNPLAAWQFLCASGGIELSQRDAALEENLRTLLDAKQETVEAALSTATMESFVAAFFQLVQPFVSIFRDILAFFEQAGCTEGQGQWVLKVNEIDMDLGHFRRWIERLSPAGKVTLHVSAVDKATGWSLRRILGQRRLVDDEASKFLDCLHRNGDPRSLQLPEDVQDWVRAYVSGVFFALPVSLSSTRCPPSLNKSAVVVDAVISMLHDLGLNREGLMRAYRGPQRGVPQDKDGLNFWNIAQDETDYWLGGFVVALSAAATLLPAAELEAVGVELNCILDRFPLRTMEFSRSLKDLESVLSLPIWKKRYELYSVWIGTEIVRSAMAAGHDVELHHDNGHIAFAFRETAIATIHSSPGPFQLISEKRSKLDAPVGHGRRAGVQPDFGLWTIIGGSPECRMVIEVKHYLRAAKGRFLEVLQDYARALPTAQIYLVNHGPVGSVWGELDIQLRDRCRTLEQFIPSNTERRKELDKAVQACLGKPIPTWHRVSVKVDAGAVFAFDVSGSMKPLLNARGTETFLLEVLASTLPAKFVGIDTTVMGSWPPTREGFASIVEKQGGSTSLAEPVRMLLDEFERVFVFTDEEGLRNLAEFSSQSQFIEGSLPVGLFLRVCT